MIAQQQECVCLNNCPVKKLSLSLLLTFSHLFRREQMNSLQSFMRSFGIPECLKERRKQRDCPNPSLLHDADLLVPTSSTDSLIILIVQGMIFIRKSFCQLITPFVGIHFELSQWVWRPAYSLLLLSPIPSNKSEKMMKK